jgi:hypothetical protein
METIWAKHMMTNVPCQASGERLPILRRMGITRFNIFFVEHHEYFNEGKFPLVLMH